MLRYTIRYYAVTYNVTHYTCLKIHKLYRLSCICFILLKKYYLAKCFSCIFLKKLWSLAVDAYLGAGWTALSFWTLQEMVNGKWTVLV